MSIKTPAEIAEECALKVVDHHHHNDQIEKGVTNPGIGTLAWCLGERITYETGLVELVTLAIEADRAQRAADLAILTDAASKWATELTAYVIPEANNETLAGYQAERDAIEGVLGRDANDAEGTPA